MCVAPVATKSTGPRVVSFAVNLIGTGAGALTRGTAGIVIGVATTATNTGIEASSGDYSGASNEATEGAVETDLEVAGGWFEKVGTTLGYVGTAVAGYECRFK